jgi:hypothetical protein
MVPSGAVLADVAVVLGVAFVILYSMSDLIVVLLRTGWPRKEKTDLEAGLPTVAIPLLA